MTEAQIEGSFLNRAKWFKVHSWVGFKLSILLSFTLVTGTLAVLSHELDWLTNSAMRVDAGSVDKLDWLAIYKSAKVQQPNKHLLHLNAPLDPWFAAEVAYFETENTYHRNFFHPSTGEYLGDGRWYNWQRFFRMSHRHLMVPTKIGVTIVGALGFLLFVSLITSLVVYRKWWKGFFRMPRRAHRKLFWADVHRLAGVWSLWFVAIIAVTGMWYFVEVWGLRADYPDRGKAHSEQALDAKVLPSVTVFAKMLAQVETVYPELTVTRVFFPQRNGDGVIFQGQADAILVRPRANMLSFDPISGEVLVKNQGLNLSIHARISEAADPLHFGTFAGFPSKVLYFIFGIVLSTLAISGTYIYGMRIARAPKSQPVSRAQFWQAASNTMTWGKWFSIVAIVVCFVITVLLFGGFITP